MARIRFCVAPDPECDETQVGADPGAEWVEPFGHGIGRSTVEQSIKAGRPLAFLTPEIKSLIDLIRRIDGYDESKEAVAVEEHVK